MANPQLSREVKELIKRFFTLADTNAGDAGERLAKEIFTHDRVFILANGTCEGARGKVQKHWLQMKFNLPLSISTEISQSRKEAWISVKYRHHEVLKVYANDMDGTDHFIVGVLNRETL